MKNNIDLLKTFTRKLANCKHLISAEQLTKYLDNGSFGYSFDENGDNLITNDCVFADETAMVVEHIRAIFDEPHIALKREEAIRNAAVATDFDNRSITATMKDEKLWRVRLGELKPEFVHTYVKEDNLAIYENCFICYLLDHLYQIISKKVDAICKNIATFNKKIDETNDIVAYEQKRYIKYTEDFEPIPLLAKSSSPQVIAIGSLLKTRTTINSLRNFEIYKACKKVGFDINNLKPTNILNCDKNYNYCYRYYLKFLQNTTLSNTENSMYSQYVLVNLMSAIKNSGYNFADESKDIIINANAELKAERVCFVKDMFRIDLSKNENDIVLNVTELSDGSTAKYLFKMITGEQKLQLGKSINEYVASLNEDKEYTQVFVITDEISALENVIYVAAGDYSSNSNLIKAIKSITLLVEGAEFIYNRYCPVCGTTLIAPDGGDLCCTGCETLYHNFHYGNRDLIWLKRLPVKAEKKAKTEETLAYDNGGANESVTIITREVIQKSFLGKMSQATKEQIAYYNEIKNHLLSYKRVNSRISWNSDSFNIGREKAVKIAFRGQTLVAYLALNPNDYVDTKYYPHDVSDKKKFEETPMMVKIKSDRGVKNAKELIDVICKDLTVKNDFSPAEYSFNYMTDEQLVENGLAKIILMKQLANSVSSTTITSNPLNSEIADIAVAATEEPVKQTARKSIQKSFVGKMSQASKEQIIFYNELKNYLLSFKRVNSRISWSCDSFNIGREKAVKIAFRGKTLVAYLALDPSKYADTKYYPHDMGNKKKFADTPMMVKLKSVRGVKNAKQLIATVCQDLPKIKDFKRVEYKFPRMSDKKLLENGLAKEVIVTI